MAVFVVKNERQQTHVTMGLVVCSNYSRNHSKFISEHLGDNSLVGICAMNHMWSRGISRGYEVIRMFIGYSLYLMNTLGIYLIFPKNNLVPYTYVHYLIDFIPLFIFGLFCAPDS